MLNKLKELAPRLTVCLAMDLKGSTTAGLKLSSRKIDRFNLALVQQVTPYMELLQFEGAILKFTGDGWLVVSDEQEEAAKLCCLAIIMARRFQVDIVAATGLALTQVPALRLAICWGRDLPVTLPNGTKDFVGSSVRRAVRACQFSQDNEVLVDDTVRAWITHDFAISRCNLGERLTQLDSAKTEDDLVLHVLETLKTESADDLEAPVYFVDTLSVIGRSEEAEGLANRISDLLLEAATTSQKSEAELVAAYEELLTSNIAHETARRVITDLKRSGLCPSLEMYHGLLEKADDLAAERGWISELEGDGLTADSATLNICLKKARTDEEAEWFANHLLERGVQPNSESLSYLIEKSMNYRTAAAWADRLAKLGVTADLRSHELMISRAESFDTARFWLEAAMTAGWEPGEQAFLDTFSKGVLGLSGDKLLSWYLSLPTHPAHPIKRAIADYRKAGRVADSLRLCLDYPHTDTAMKTFRQFPDQAMAYFYEIVAKTPDHPNGAYALGMVLLGAGRVEEAAPWLRKAYNLATPGHRKDELARQLAFFDSVLAMKEA